MAALSNGAERGKMDTLTKTLNYLSIFIGVSIGVGTGWLALASLPLRDATNFIR